MSATTIINDQLWQSYFFINIEQHTSIRNLYRVAENNLLKMQYDNRLQTDCLPQLNSLCADFAPLISEIVGESLKPQVGWVCVDLPDAHIKMHRLHPDIHVQVQIPLTLNLTDALSYSFCTNAEINNTLSDDHQPFGTIEHIDCVHIKHMPRSAVIYKNSPRTFNGMLEPIPLDTVRETLWLNYTK